MLTPHRRVFRADHVGSLVRPRALVQARQEFAAGRLAPEQLRAVEDDAIRACVRLQEAAGLPVVTDGEFRRGTYSDAFTSHSITGVRVELSEPSGWGAVSATFAHRTARRIPRVVEKIRWAGGRNAEDFAFLKSVTSRTPKLTLPGPAYIHYRAGRDNISRDIYPNLDSFWSDLVDAYRVEMRSAADAGCELLQIDETSLVKLGDERARALLSARGDDWRDLLRLYIEVLNEIAAAAPQGLQLSIHICRSQDQNWQAEASYEPIAKALFNDLEFSTYLLEFDNARAGGFEPLRWVPSGKHVVLGLVSSKNPALEQLGFLESKLAEAGQFVSIGQLALSPQCGFSTSAASAVTLSEEQQSSKLQRVAEAAKAVWGRTEE